MLTHHNPGGDARKPASPAVQLHRRWGWQMPGPMTTKARPPALDAGRATTAAGDGPSGVTHADRLWIALTLGLVVYALVDASRPEPATGQVK